MKKFLSTLFAIILVFSVFAFCGCNGTKHALTFYSFNATPIDVVIYGKNFSEELKKGIETELENINQTFSATKNGSLISQINATDFTQTTLSEEEIKIFESAKTLCDFTNEKFNPAIHLLSKAWSFSPTFPVSAFSPPEQTLIDRILSSGAIDFDNVVLDEQLGVLTKINPETSIDLGGIIKGYATDKISEILISHGVEKGYINVGSSSIKTLKMNAVAVRHPEDTSKNIVKINLDKENDYSISTSGDYERFYNYKGTKYSHIIDGTSGKPYSTKVISATVITSMGMDADALSTALCLCSFNPKENSDELREFIKKITNDANYLDSKIYAVYSDGNQKYLITNEKQSENFTLLDDDYTIVNI